MSWEARLRELSVDPAWYLPPSVQKKVEERGWLVPTDSGGHEEAPEFYRLLKAARSRFQREAPRGAEDVRALDPGKLEGFTDDEVLHLCVWWRWLTRQNDAERVAHEWGQP